VARGEAGPESDVDLIAEIDHSTKFSLIDPRRSRVRSRRPFGPPCRYLDSSMENAPTDATARRSGCDRGFLMSITDLAARLEDILAAICEIERFAAGKAFDDYTAEPMLRRAIECDVEIISEASRYIPEDPIARHPIIPWRKVAGIGNV
jgi:Protein of unknown function DUF86